MNKECHSLVCPGSVGSVGSVGSIRKYSDIYCKNCKYFQQQIKLAEATPLSPCPSVLSLALSAPLYLVPYPGSEGGDPGVDPRVERLGTSLAPAHHTHHHSSSPRASLGQRSARVSLAGVPAPTHYPGTQHARDQLAAVHRVHGGAGRVGDDVDVHREQPGAGLVGLLTGRPEARHRGEGVDRRLEVSRGETDGNQPAGGAETDRPPQGDHGDVVLQGRLVKLGVEDDLPYLPPDGGDGVGGVVLGQEDVHHAVEVGLHPGQAVGGREAVSVSEERAATENTPGHGQADLPGHRACRGRDSSDYPTEAGHAPAGQAWQG